MEHRIIDRMATGAKIAMLRREKHIKIMEISDYLGFENPQAIYKWQRGESLPSLDNLVALSRLLGVSIEEILVLTEDEEGGSSRREITAFAA